jgi:hypothetical protein
LFLALSDTYLNNENGSQDRAVTGFGFRTGTAAAAAAFNIIVQQIFFYLANISLCHSNDTVSVSSLKDITASERNGAQKLIFFLNSTPNKNLVTLHKY